MSTDEALSGFAWGAEKNARLKRERGFGFEDIIVAIGDGGLLDDVVHPSPDYAHQRILIVCVGDKVIAVPYVMDGDVRFLKTAYASRSARKRYLGR